jgi:uncharacterized phiE125 gp8 family phage protein
MPDAGQVPPAAALQELKAYLRIEDSREDALLAGLLRAATETVEAMLGLLLFEREVDELGLLAGDALPLTAAPARSLIAVERLLEDGTWEPVEPGTARLKLRAQGTGTVRIEGVPQGTELRVRYRAGMAGDWNWVPEALRLSVLRAAAHFHAHRDDPGEAGLPPAVRRMLTPWRARRMR